MSREKKVEPSSPQMDPVHMTVINVGTGQEVKLHRVDAREQLKKGIVALNEAEAKRLREAREPKLQEGDNNSNIDDATDTTDTTTPEPEKEKKADKKPGPTRSK